MKASTQTSVFSPSIHPTLLQIVAKLSKGPTSVVSQICDVLMDDLRRLCEYAKKVGDISEMKIKHVTRSSYPRENFGEFAGTYVGFGLGQQWLELGFLEKPVVEMLRARLKESQANFLRPESGEYQTMLSSARRDCELYLTAEGAYEFSHTYAWFIKRRVD